MEKIFTNNVINNESATIKTEDNIAPETVKDGAYYFLHYFLEPEYYMICGILITLILISLGATLYYLWNRKEFINSGAIDNIILLFILTTSILLWTLPLIHLAISFICISFSLDTQLLNLYEIKIQINLYITILLIIASFLALLRVFLKYSYFKDIYWLVLIYFVIFTFSYLLFQELPFYLISSLTKFDGYFIILIKILLIVFGVLESLLGYLILYFLFKKFKK